jgi:hypothetical protein
MPVRRRAAGDGRFSCCLSHKRFGPAGLTRRVSHAQWCRLRVTGLLGLDEKQIAPREPPLPGRRPPSDKSVKQPRRMVFALAAVCALLVIPSAAVVYLSQGQGLDRYDSLLPATLNPPFLHALQASCLAILPSFFL